MSQSESGRHRRLGRQVIAVDLIAALVAFSGSLWLISIAAPSVALGIAHDQPLSRWIVGSTTFLVTMISGRRTTSQVVAGLQFYTSALRGSGFAVVACAVVSYFVELHGRALVVAMLVVLPISRVLCRWWLRQYVRRANRRLGDELPTAVLVGVHSNLEVTMKADTALGFRPVSTPHLRSPNEVAEVIRALNASAVVLDRQIGSPAEFRELVWKVEELGCKVMVSTPLGLMAPNDIVVIPTASHDLMVLSTAALGPSAKFGKRALELAITPILIMLTLPVLVVAMTALLVTSGLPVLHRGTRIGRDGEPFTLYKLRTLAYSESDPLNQASVAPALSAPKSAPPGATRVGGFLRRWSIDELPQLFQVISGSMSLIGPRPRLPHEHEESAVLMRRLNVRPGITGLWQVSGRGDLSLNEAAELDVRYVDSWSLFGDVTILLRTLKTVMTGKGAR